jgi:hypothetical protein
MVFLVFKCSNANLGPNRDFLFKIGDMNLQGILHNSADHARTPASSSSHSLFPQRLNGTKLQRSDNSEYRYTYDAEHITCYCIYVRVTYNMKIHLIKF